MYCWPGHLWSTQYQRHLHRQLPRRRGRPHDIVPLPRSAFNLNDDQWLSFYQQKFIEFNYKAMALKQKMPDLYLVTALPLVSWDVVCLKSSEAFRKNYFYCSTSWMKYLVDKLLACYGFRPLHPPPTTTHHHIKSVLISNHIKSSFL